MNSIHILMRLINLHTLELEEFHDQNVPPYAILSHTWQDGEVTFAQWNTPDHGSNLEGFRKIGGFRAVVRKTYKLDYAWVDTCCIDKSSSAELTEAINSMYLYYANAAVCLVHLADVDVPFKQYFDVYPPTDHGIANIRRSRWFTRGWTLQELIAPASLHFYGAGWVDLGPMSRGWSEIVASITGVPERVLQKKSALSQWSVATRMSWAAKRKTTRIEDEAYSLLGIFDVSLPLIYGEGRRAFVRLQEEIIRRSTDHSIFAWDHETEVNPTGFDLHPHAERLPLPQSIVNVGYPAVTPAGSSIMFNPQPNFNDAELDLLASSPANFAIHSNSRIVVQCYQEVKGWVESYNMTNLGLRLNLPLVPCQSQLGMYHAVLNCRFEDDAKGPIALNVRRSSQTSNCLKAESQHDVNTTTFGVLPTNRLPDSRFHCSCRSINRLSVVDEEDLLQNDKVPVTILRTHRPKLMNKGLSYTKSRLGSSRLSNPLAGRDFEPGRLKLIMIMDGILDLERHSVQPTAEWDTTSPIWYASGPAGAITFVSEGLPTAITLLFVKGTSRAEPFHIAVYQSSSFQLSRHQSEAMDLRKRLPAQHPGMKISSLLHGVSVHRSLERMEKMGKFFNILKVTIATIAESPSPPPAGPPTGSSMDAASEFLQKVDLIDKSSHMESHSLAVGSISSLEEHPPDVKSGDFDNRATSAGRLVKKFSFE